MSVRLVTFHVTPAYINNQYAVESDHGVNIASTHRSPRTTMMSLTRQQYVSMIATVNCYYYWPSSTLHTHIYDPRPTDTLTCTSLTQFFLIHTQHHYLPIIKLVYKKHGIINSNWFLYAEGKKWQIIYNFSSN